ncbi:alpha/beta fold hydrolase [Patiriisocius marinus]|uniref:alpha/beta fold hydrolase n=1 Tax=Patiriisocius marinus TaxID=1397112 RepID=UPI002330A6E2|nr:alpha/beta hydrolase [Patiriisocius marinus]
MKKLVILLVIFFYQTITYSQSEKYSFNIEIKGKGKPIILIPGLGSSGKVWEETTDILEKNFECHILTLAGFANQNAISIEKGYLPIIENEIIKYIQDEFDEKPILIGHSLGGFLSLSIASSQPKLLEKIIIVDSYPFMSLAYNPKATVESVLPQAKIMKEMMLSTSDSLFIQQQKMTMPTMITGSSNIQLATKWSIQSDRNTMAQAIYELMTTDLRNDIEKVKIPILVFGSWYGAKDYGITKETVLANYQNQFLKADNCQIKVAETAKHFIMWDEPKWFINSVEAFINYEE